MALRDKCGMKIQPGVCRGNHRLVSKLVVILMCNFRSLEQLKSFRIPAPSLAHAGFGKHLSTRTSLNCFDVDLQKGPLKPSEQQHHEFTIQLLVSATSIEKYLTTSTSS